MRILIASCLLLIALSAMAETTITYQGQLQDGGGPVDGSVDMEFFLYDTEEAGTLLESDDSRPVTVTDGLFQTELDFGQQPWADGLWLEIVIDNGDPLLPRQRLTAAPLALGVAAGVLPDDYWALGGNAGTSAGPQFLGTTDDQPFEIRTNGSRHLRIEPSSEAFDGEPITANIIAGSSANTVADGVRGATIAGGGVPEGFDDPVDSFNVLFPNLASSHYGSIGGGTGNTAGDEASVSGSPFATVGGGRSNTASGSQSTVGGGRDNAASGSRSTVGGGFVNTASGPSSTVGGGDGNTASGSWSTVGGGRDNTASGPSSTVAGGYNNTASDFYSTVGGGNTNTASGFESTVGGGRDNTASGSWSTVPGGRDNEAAGGYSFAAGRNAKASDDGTFVWADSEDDDFVSSGPDQFLVRAAGGVGVNTEFPQAALDVDAASGQEALRVRIGGLSALRVFDNRGVSIGSNITPPERGLRVLGEMNLLSLGSGTSTTLCISGITSGIISNCSSSARYKKDINDLASAGDLVAQLRAVSYRWKKDDRADIGLIAEEVAAAEPRLATFDEDGEVRGVKYRHLTAVLVAAWQEQRAEQEEQEERTAEQEERLAELEAENAELKAQLAEQREATAERLAALEAMLLEDRRVAEGQ